MANLIDIKRFPESVKPKKSSYEKVFSGYKAIHYRVKLKENDQIIDDKKYFISNETFY